MNITLTTQEFTMVKRTSVVVRYIDSVPFYTIETYYESV